MSEFTTISGGKAWSAAPGQNMSLTVAMKGDRPDAEVRLSDFKVEVRTGARVTRARGALVTLKRSITALRSILPEFLGGLSKAENDARILRHAEYRFDRYVNRLVEDLFNDDTLEVFDVGRRLNRIHEEAEKIQTYRKLKTKDELVERFRVNLHESLAAVSSNKNSVVLDVVLRAFEEEGPLHNLMIAYAIYSDPDTVALMCHDENDRKGMQISAEQYVNHIASFKNSDRYDFVQGLIAQINDIPGIAHQVRNASMQTVNSN